MSEDNLKQTDDTKISNNDSKSKFFKEKFSIPFPNTKEERKILFFEFKQREREFKIGSQMLIEENALIIDRMDIYQMFNINFLHNEVKRYDLPNIKISNIWSFAKNLCEIGYLTRITFPLFSKYMRKKHKGNEIIKYAVYDCEKWRFNQLEEIKELDKIFHLEDLGERDFQMLRERNKKPLTSEEASEKVRKTNSLIQEKSFIDKIEFERKNRRKGKEERMKNENISTENNNKRRIDIKSGIICPSDASQMHLEKMKNKITTYTTGRHMGQTVNWLDRHFENCKIKFEDHPPE